MVQSEPSGLTRTSAWSPPSKDCTLAQSWSRTAVQPTRFTRRSTYPVDLRSRRCSFPSWGPPLPVTVAWPESNQAASQPVPPSKSPLSKSPVAMRVVTGVGVGVGVDMGVGVGVGSTSPQPSTIPVMPADCW